MKKLLVFLCCVIICLLSVTVMADPLVCGDFEYELIEDGTAILGLYIGAEGADVVIPKELDGHLVMGTSDNPFWKTPVSSVTVAEDHPYFVMIDGVLFGKSDTKLIYYPPNLPDAVYEIPVGMDKIGKHAFYGCTNVINLKMASNP